MRAVDRGIGFVTTLILARLLAPSDFGVVAMGTAVYGILTSLTEFGFTKALVAMERPRHDAYSTAFTLNFFTNAIVTVALLVLIPAAESWYDDSRVGGVLVTLAATSFIGGLRNMGLARYERVLNFRPFFLLALARKASSFIVGVALAMIWADYRALLAGMLIGTVVETGLSFRLTRFRPKFTLARSRDLLRFSGWLLGSEVTTTLGQRGQDVVLGQQLGAGVLGHYAIALDIATMAPTEIVAPVTRAMFPGYMQMKADAERLFLAFVRVWGVIALLTIPSAVGLALLADQVVEVVLGPKWLDAVPLIGGLAAVGCIQGFRSCCAPVLLARLGPGIVFKLSALSVCLIIPSFAIALEARGLMLAIGAWLASASLVLFISVWLILKDLGGTVAHVLKPLGRPLVASSVMALTLVVARAVDWQHGAWMPAALALMLLVLLGMAVYGGTALGLWAMLGKPNGAERDALFFATARIRGQRS